MPITTTPSERIGRCTRMRRFFVRFNRPESFVHTLSSAGFTIITSGLEFSVHTAGTADRYRLVRELSFGIRDFDLHRGVRGGEPGGNGDDARLHRTGHINGI